MLTFSQFIQLKEAEQVDEARKLEGTYTGAKHTTKVYKLSGEHNDGDDYHVKVHKDGKHYEAGDYFTNDKADAHETAKAIALKESIQLDEGRKLEGTYTGEKHTVKVYKLSGEHHDGDDYHVKVHKDGKHYEAGDYFTNDKADAHETAKSIAAQK